MSTMPSSVVRQTSAETSRSRGPGLFAANTRLRIASPKPETTSKIFNTCALPKEPEDATLTGATRSLARRLLALNLSGATAGHEPATRNPTTHA